MNRQLSRAQFSTEKVNLQQTVLFSETLLQRTTSQYMYHTAKSYTKYGDGSGAKLQSL